MSKEADQLKEKFRPDNDARLEAEIDDALGDLSIEALLDSASAPATGGKPQGPKGGPKRGKIIRVDQKKDEVFVDFGGKSQGLIAASAFEEPPEVGTEMEFDVEKFDASEGLILLRLKGAAQGSVSWETMEVGQVVEGTVTGVNKGGLELQVKSMRAFMPSGQVDLYFQPDISTFLNQKMTVEVTQFDAHAKNLIVSRRNILEREKEEQKQKLIKEIAEGQTRRGTIRSVMDYGAFVDLGGLDGLLHVSEISHRRGTKVSDMVKVGDVVDVKIVKFDKETGKLGLSLKQMMADPWVGAADKYAVGSTITGRVSKIENFGAFIEVEEGIEGLLPVSEMSWQRIKHPKDVVKEGDTLRLVILSIDPVAHRISFSLKQAGTDPWSIVSERYAPQTNTKGTVTRVVDFGAFVELEPGLEGLIHISELSDQRIRSAGDAVKAGEEVEVRILEIDSKARRMSLSLKQARYGAAQAAAAATPTPAKPAAKRKTPLKGGLDF